MKILLVTLKFTKCTKGHQYLCRYSLIHIFGNIKNKQSDFNIIDVKPKHLLSLYKAHQQKAEVKKLYLPLEEGD